MMVPMALAIEIEIEHFDHHDVVRINGRLDALTAMYLEKALDDLRGGGRHQLLMDFANVDYLSSAGMRVLLATAKKLKKKGGKCLFCSINDDVMEMIKMAGFEQILAIYLTEEDALAAI